MNKIEEAMENIHTAKTTLIKRNRRDKSLELDDILKDLDVVLDKLDVYNSKNRKSKKRKN